MNRRDFLRSACSSALALGMGARWARASESKPNIILIISDDAGYSDFGFNGGRQIPTPHLDRLAREGVVCTQGYVTASVCCPSRMGLMTGRYQQRFGAECNCPAIATPGFTKGDLGLDPGERTMGDDLRHAGYKTMMIGKWHLGEPEQYHPLQRGFDEFYGFLGGSRSYWPIKSPGVGAAMMRNHQRLNEEEQITYTTDNLTDAALDFIERHKDRPFFVYLSYNAVHTPMHAKEEDIEQCADISPQRRRIYAAMTRSMDQNVGRVTKAGHVLGRRHPRSLHGQVAGALAGGPEISQSGEHPGPAAHVPGGRSCRPSGQGPGRRQPAALPGGAQEGAAPRVSLLAVVARRGRTRRALEADPRRRRPASGRT